jgi:hypothetical protein
LEKTGKFISGILVDPKTSGRIFLAGGFFVPYSIVMGKTEQGILCCKECVLVPGRRPEPVVPCSGEAKREEKEQTENSSATVEYFISLLVTSKVLIGEKW